MTEVLPSRIATAPISWGVCEVPGWGHQLPPERVLAEMAELGFAATELGSAGWLPESANAIAEVLHPHGLEVLAAFVPLVLHDRTQREAELKAAEDTAQMLREAGARYFNTAPVTSHDWQPRQPLTNAEWDSLVDGLAAVESICANYGLSQVVHEHFGCVIETADEITRLLDTTPVAFVLDTGHLAVGGFDPLDFAKRHADRVGLVHLKDTKLEIVPHLTSGEMSLMEAVQAGLFPALGHGGLPIDEIVTSLEHAGYRGHYVVEQDCAITGELPAPGDGPVRDVAISVAYLKHVTESLTSFGALERARSAAETPLPGNHANH